MISRRMPSKFRAAAISAVLALAYVTAVAYYKDARLNQLSQRGLASLRDRHAKVQSLFQSSFYFFHEDQFLPGVQRVLADGQAPRLQGVAILSASDAKGSVLFDSTARQKPAEPYAHPEILKASLEPVVYRSGYEIRILVPGPQTLAVYSFDGGEIRSRVLGALLGGLLLGLLLRWSLSGSWAARGWARAGVLLQRGWRRFWKLRLKFVLAIVVIDLFTAAVLFFSLVQLQTKEQTERIQRDSILFSQFSTAQVVSNFTNFFYFYYNDRFIPEMKRIIASNENLVSLRVISKRTGAVLYDSERSSLSFQPGAAIAAIPGTPGEVAGVAGPTAESEAESTKADLTGEIQEQLKTRDLATRFFKRGDESLLSIVTLHRNESQEPTFLVEYLFNFQTLERSIRAIRRQILLDLVPSLGLGLLVAIFFAQLLLSPIRKLMAAVNRVSGGDYDVSVDIKRSDEIGELVGSFNGMTSELRKKQELRKYLSDSTYRKVMNATDTPSGTQKLGGSRVLATVLFSDIRNFVGHCENLEAEEVTAMLNEYFSEMVQVVTKHGGEVDKFIGDAILAVFYSSPVAEEHATIRPSDANGGGLPTSSATALQAIYCAMEMRERLAEFNERRRAAQKRTIEIGVGITHGEIISGPIGSKDRMDFTVIGDVVNLANRIEKLSKQGRHTKIVFSHQIEPKIRGLLDYEEMATEKVRGKEEVVHVFELIGIRDLETLMGNLRSEDRSLRQRSVELLGQSRNPAALALVTEALDDGDELTRLQAVLAIARLAPQSDAAAFASLAQHLKSETSDKVVSALITALGKLATAGRVDEVIEALALFLDSSNERIVANAVEALGQVRSPRCADLVLPKINSRNNRVKANAAMALFAAGHVEVIDTLKPMLMHSDPLMRSSAAFALGELTVITPWAEQDSVTERWRTQTQTLKYFLAELQACVPMLVTLLRDAEPMVRRQAVIALGKIKDKSAVLPMIDMLDPSRDSRELIADISAALRSIGSHKLVREVIAKLSQ